MKTYDFLVLNFDLYQTWKTAWILPNITFASVLLECWSFTENFKHCKLLTSVESMFLADYTNFLFLKSARFRRWKWKKSKRMITTKCLDFRHHIKQTHKDLEFPSTWARCIMKIENSMIKSCHNKKATFRQLFIWFLAFLRIIFYFITLLENR